MYLASAFRSIHSARGIKKLVPPGNIILRTIASHTAPFYINMSKQEKGGILNWVDPKDKSGEFKRAQSAFRNWISKEQGAEFPPEKDRYHLYVSYACPWGEPQTSSFRYYNHIV